MLTSLVLQIPKHLSRFFVNATLICRSPYIEIAIDAKNFVADLLGTKSKVQGYKAVEYEFKQSIEINGKGGLEWVDLHEFQVIEFQEMYN